jgi:hypothetical protein
MKTYWGWSYSSTIFKRGTRGEWKDSRPGCSTPTERADDTHWKGSLYGHCGRQKILTVGNRTPAVQAVAQCYTDWDMNFCALYCTMLGFLNCSDHQLYVLRRWRHRSDCYFFYFNPTHTSLQSLTIIYYAVTGLHNYNPYTFVTTITCYTLALADFLAINYCLE